MKPLETWINDWSYGIDQKTEKKSSEELLALFSGFWIWANLDEKSIKTQRRYSTALHALGGYLIMEIGEGNKNKDSIVEFVRSKIGDGCGPLVYIDNEQWQREIDLVCRRLYKYIEQKVQFRHK